MSEQEILLQITELQERATAASLECIHFMDKDNPQTKKYIAALKVHVETTKEINRLKQMLNEKTN